MTPTQAPGFAARACAVHGALFLLALGAASCATLPQRAYVPYVPKGDALELLEHEAEQGLVSRKERSSVVVRVDSTRPWHQAVFQLYVLNRDSDQAVVFGRSSVALEALRDTPKGGTENQVLEPMSTEDLDKLHGKLVSRERRKKAGGVVKEVAKGVFWALVITAAVVSVLTLCGGGGHCGGWHALDGIAWGNTGGGKKRQDRAHSKAERMRALEEQKRLIEAIPRVIDERTIPPGDAVMGDFWFKPPSWRPVHYELVVHVGAEEHRFPYRMKTGRSTDPKSMIRPPGSPQWPKPARTPGQRIIP